MTKELKTLLDTIPDDHLKQQITLAYYSNGLSGDMKEALKFYLSYTKIHGKPKDDRLYSLEDYEK